MDAYEATKVVFARVQGLVDADLASKIMGMLLTQDKSEEDMIRLAFGPEHLLQSVVADLAAYSKPPSPPAPAWRMAPGAAGGDGEGGLPFAAASEAFYPEEEYGCWSPASGAHHRRSFSLSDAEGGWKLCQYFARGFCKNGSDCRFLHGLPEDVAEQEMSVIRAKAVAAARSQMMAPAFAFSPSPPKGLGFLLQQQQQQQQQSESQRASDMLLAGGDDMHRFSLRSPRMDRGELAINHGPRQIYLTFPADSTFTEEDVSSYFSMYGPVQDVRIPHQPKRMFGFVSFVYPETVRLVLAKGNPHFVCDARVLVKPYKEKGKVPDRFRHGGGGGGHCLSTHHREFAAVGSGMPSAGLLDSRDPFDLQQPQIGQRMLYGSMAGHEAAFLRRNLEEQQQQQEAAELQHAIELQGRRLMGLQFLDLKGRGHGLLGSPVGSPSDGNGVCFSGNGSGVHLEDAISTIQDNNRLSSGLFMGTYAAACVIAKEGKQVYREEGGDGNGSGNGNGNGSPKQPVNSGEEGRRESGPGAAAASNVCEYQESGMEPKHNLPGSPFAFPTKEASIAAAAAEQQTAHTGGMSNSSSPHLVASSLFPPAKPLYSSCFSQVPRLSSGQGAIGL
ncbi:zinc finger CCCH domain-containing protein 23-like isoform X1 [Hordeum vulgare subsp. vulgare]|uniref:C3H1-type domain-containing protein n=1 Tax=Hordeum vulgare subsp. vulgare TaxID=112509 RepID=A0A8I6X033_HORVV|nr:zinc finger CCCH domain-containing protein 23-like isoform X1 [Hordeum vulgare subsp. vulgare]